MSCKGCTAHHMPCRGALCGCIAELKQHVLDLERQQKEQADGHQGSEQRLRQAQGLLQLGQVSTLSWTCSCAAAHPPEAGLLQA